MKTLVIQAGLAFSVAFAVPSLFGVAPTAPVTETSIPDTLDCAGGIPDAIGIDVEVLRANGATLDVAIALEPRSEGATRVAYGFWYADDRGELIGEPSRIFRDSLEKNGIVHPLTTPKLDDGFYLLQVVVAVDGEEQSVERRRLYLEVAKGEASVLHVDDWHDRSDAMLAHHTPAKGDHR